MAYISLQEKDITYRTQGMFVKWIGDAYQTEATEENPSIWMQPVYYELWADSLDAEGNPKNLRFLIESGNAELPVDYNVYEKDPAQYEQHLNAILATWGLQVDPTKPALPNKPSV